MKFNKGDEVEYVGSVFKKGSRGVITQKFHLPHRGDQGGACCVKFEDGMTHYVFAHNLIPVKKKTLVYRRKE